MTLRNIRFLPGDRGRIVLIGFAPDPLRLVILGPDGFRYFDPATGEPAAPAAGPYTYVQAAAISPDGRRV